MSDERRHSHSGRVFWGLVLILVGALVLFKPFDIYDLGYLFSTWWPAIFILIGISMLIENGFRRPLGGVLFILFGALFLLHELDYFDFDVWRHVWPIGLIILGLWILFRPILRSRSREAIPPAAANDIDLAAIFSGTKRRIDAPNFKGGEVSAVFGQADLDFTGAGLEGGKATVEASAIFGGITIIVPRDWRVVANGTPVLGSFDVKHKNPPETEAKATLYVRGTAVFGSVTIKD
ncbi:MAG: LiaF transmembrane domain-containing protein [Candidatus Aminicenantales bacterium]